MLALRTPLMEKPFTLFVLPFKTCEMKHRSILSEGSSKPVMYHQMTSSFLCQRQQLQYAGYLTPMLTSIAERLSATMRQKKDSEDKNDPNHIYPSFAAIPYMHMLKKIAG